MKGVLNTTSGVQYTKSAKPSMVHDIPIAAPEITATKGFSRSYRHVKKFTIHINEASSANFLAVSKSEAYLPNELKSFPDEK